MSDRIETLGISAKSLWGSSSAEENERARFGALYASLPFKDIESVLDVGCGFGRLRDDLRARGWIGQYVGIEASEPVYRQIPSRDRDTFIHGQVFDAPTNLFDVTVAFGIFNHKQAFEEPDLGFAQTLEAMWQRTRYACVVDFLCPESDYVADIAIHRGFSDVLGAFLRRTKKVALDHTFLPFEYMVVAYR